MATVNKSAVEKAQVALQEKKVEIAFQRATIKEMKDSAENRKHKRLLEKIDAVQLLIDTAIETPTFFDEREIKRIKMRMMLLIDKL